MTYLVTGGTGFIGSYVVRILIQDGEQVVAYDVAPDKSLLKHLMGKEKSDRVIVIPGDITDLAHLIRSCQEHNVETVIHTAAVLVAENPWWVTQVNCVGTLNVLEAARILGIKRVAMTSSVSVFGPPDRYKEEYISNDAPHFPRNIYGASKSFNEACAMQYFTDYGLETITIRLAHVYGFGRTNTGLGRVIDEELFTKPALGKPGSVPYGDDTHNFIYIEDAARVMVMASRVGKTRTRAFTAGGGIHSTAEIAAHIKSLIPNAEINLLPGLMGWAYKFDTTPVMEEIGYRPEWTIEQGVKQFIEDIQKQHRAA